VVLQLSFMQQNQRLYEDGCRSCSSLIASYRLICIDSPQRGQGSPSPGMTMDFFRLRLALNPPRPILTYRKHERPQDVSVRENKQSQRRELELRWHITIGWHVAVDFETDADFNQNRCRPGHWYPPLGLANITAKGHGTATAETW
jgi:hypothetical protein